MPTSSGYGLDPDLAAAVGSLGSPVAAATTLRGSGYPGYRPSAVRLELADGRVVKGRIFRSAALAERADYVARCLGGAIVPAPIARVGAALVTEWIDGRPLQHSAAASRRCGRMLSAVHALAVPDASPYRRSSAPDGHLGLMQRCAAELVAAGVLDVHASDDALAVARRFLPPRCTIGFVLGDLAPDNVVMRGSGEPCFIDHNTLAVDAAELDLARTWRRWPMTEAECAAFFAGYGHLPAVDAFRAHLPFWAVLVSLSAARFRLAYDVTGTAEPLQRLRDFIRDSSL